MSNASRAAVERLLEGEEFEDLGTLVAMGTDAVPSLLEVAESHADALIRARALIALGRIGDARALAAARAALGSGSRDEQLAAIRALPLLGGATAAPDLLALLSDTHPSVLRAAVRGLAAVGGPEALAALQPLAQQGPDFLKTLASAAVDEINTRIA